MNKLLLTGIALVAASSANAADMAPVYKGPPPVAAYSWTGFYIGGTIGWIRGSFDPTTSTVLGAIAPFFNAPGAVVAAVNGAGAQSNTPTNVTAGVEAGANWQWGHVVGGVEADIQSIRLSGGIQTGPNQFPGQPAGQNFTIASAASADWLFTGRGRLGLAWDNWLVYGTGGLAVTTLNAQFSFADRFGASESGLINGNTRVGYAVGGGVEVELWSGFSVKAEYLYVNFNAVSVTSTNLVIFPAVPITGQPFTHSVDLKANIGRVGLNYRL
jgi:outer membrane immunogenic protein